MTEEGTTGRSVQIGRATLRLKLGDLTQEAADALVNAANAQLAGGGGVDGALHRVGGPAIAEECQRLRAKQGGCAPGEAVATTAGRLKARVLIHTVGPVWRGGQQAEADVLRRAYQNSLALATEMGLPTVAFPSLSTGAYGYPVSLAAPVALAAIRDFLSSPAGQSLTEVRLVLHNPEDLAAYAAALASLSASPPAKATTTAAPPAPGMAVEAEVSGLAHDGAGVGRVREGGFVLFIPGALPGETVEARVEEVGPRSGRADLTRVVNASPDRVPPEAQSCQVAEGCGGCSLGHLAYPAQLAFKTRRVAEALQRIARLPEVPVAPCLGAPLTEGYRNKMQYVVFTDEAGHLRLGQLEAGSHRPVPAEDCRLATPALREAATQVSAALTAWLQPNSPGASPAAAPRPPHHVVLRQAAATGELMAILVTSDNRFPGWEGLAAELQVRLPNLVSVVQMVNPRPAGPVLNGRRTRVAGRAYLVERLGDLTFHLSPESFLQVNPAQTLPLYNQVRDCAALTGAEDLLDVYCGIGTISLYLARSARHVTGIEVVPAAVEDAAATAKLNGLPNTSFQAGPAERLLPNLARRGYRPEVVIVDPPRAGVAPEALAALASLRPRRIVYVSCDPETLARDLRRLANSGYHTQAIQPVDMFPQTSHTEAVALVTRD